jgi:hypothetical protein
MLSEHQIKAYKERLESYSIKSRNNHIAIENKIKFHFPDSNVCPLPEEWLDSWYSEIAEDGKIIDGRVILNTGEPNRCHNNVLRLFASKDGYRLDYEVVTGFGMSEDGLWVRHSWLMKVFKTGIRIYETTVPRIAYFGITVNPYEFATAK